MLAAAFIMFREVLEASLIVTIIMAATLGVPRRGIWVSYGILGGLLGAGIVAGATSWLAELFQGAGEDVVNASILSVAVVLIGWHTVWMNSHGAAIGKNMAAVGRNVAEGKKHMSVLSTVVGLAVMREGSEVVLLLQGLWTSGDRTQTIAGAVIGLGIGITVGALMYLGFLILPLRRVFAATNVILVLIAGGMAARAANFLAQAGWIPSFGTRLWDSSHLISDQSLPGQLLSALIGYIARPSGIEVVCYGLTILIVCTLMHLAGAKARRHPREYG